MRYLCTGDLHLTERSRLGPSWLDEQRKVWEQIMDVANEHVVDAILFCGDAFEHRHPTPREMKAFIQPLSGLHLGQSFYPIAGNHDVVNASYPTALEILWPHDNVRTPDKPTRTIRTLPWTPWRALGEDAADLLIASAAGIGDVDVLMMHWSVAGASLPNGLSVDQLHEPVLDTGLLEGKYGCIVAGHIHRPQEFSGGFYVGSPMCLNFGEAGVDHGCWLLDTETMRREFVILDYPPFVTVDATVDIEAHDFSGSVVRIRGFDADASNRIKQHAQDSGARDVFVEVAGERLTTTKSESVNEDLSELEAAERYCEANEIEAEPVLAATESYLAEMGS